MSNGVNRIADANPLGSGSNANSVESAAAGFDTLFPDTEPTVVNRKPEEDEDSPPRSEPARKAKAPDPDGDDGGQAPEPLFDDPILGAPGNDTPEGDEDGDADDDEGAGKDDEEGDDDEDAGDLDLDREVEVTVNGEPVKIPLKEALAGYQREADYRQKTAQVAEERREVEEYANEVVAERRQYAETLQTFIDLAESLKPSQAELDNLKATQPQLYITVREQWEAVEKKVQEAKVNRDHALERESAEATRRHTAWVREQNRKLAEAVPALANPKKAKAFRDTIFSYAKKAGYSDEEIMRGAVDHRDVLTLYKAARYDEIVRSRKTGQRKSPKASAEAASSGAPRNVSRRVAPEARKAQRDAEKRLARTGSVDDAAAAFTAMLSR